MSARGPGVRERGVAVRARGWGWRHAGRRAWAVRDLDLDVGAGERLLLLGASGSGKSTVLSGMAGLLGADSGERAGSLTLDGVAAHEARGRAGLLLQDPDTQLVMNRVGDDVAFGPENHAVAPDRIWRLVDEALELVGFPYGRSRLTGALSGGEKQRLALAGVLAVQPGLLLLDEPTANLDPDSAVALVAAVSHAVAAAGATLVVVEHRVELWAEQVDRVVVLGVDGALLADGKPADVFASRAAELTAAGVWVPGKVAARRAARHEPGEVVVVADGAGYRHRGATEPALAPTDLALRAGELTAVQGPSGSGKSTLATLVAGLARPSTGVVRAPGGERPLHRWPARALAKHVGTVFQNPEHQFVRGTVRAELEVAPRRLRWPTARTVARVDELLERLRLSRLAAANPFTLSGGQKRRLSVATALVTAPALLVLDEPTFGQDALTWTELAGMLADARDAGAALFVVSHDREFAAALADRRLTMRAGVVSRS
ncbi:ABC transporter ATP-binding protein [uncultured Jatrophihabitans sp.]|uniref:ABC transporter ATP-binding protein n=1 Tax=uncultured Jatrophihabitans sp. TaxID=1610747 RepID=UPI0035CB18D5